MNCEHRKLEFLDPEYLIIRPPILQSAAISIDPLTPCRVYETGVYENSRDRGKQGGIDREGERGREKEEREKERKKEGRNHTYVCVCVHE